MSDPSQHHPPESGVSERSNVVRLADYQPSSQPPLNDRELMFLRTLIANHAELMRLVFDSRDTIAKISTGCPVARRILLDP